MPQIDWKLCAGAIGVIIVLTLLLIRLHPTLHRIEQAVVGLGPPPGAREKKGKLVAAEAGRLQSARQRSISTKLATDPPRGDTEAVTQKASQDPDADSTDFDL